MQEITSSLLIMLRCWTGLFEEVHRIEKTINGNANKSFFIFQNLCEDKHSITEFVYDKIKNPLD